MWRSIMLLVAALTLFSASSESAPLAPSAPADVATAQAPATGGVSVGEQCSLAAPAAQYNPLAQKPCCSGSGGFCGCTGGKMQCCNGETKPECACRADASAAGTVDAQK